MAINVNTVYTTVLSILNKEQRGYLTPYEFNQLATQVQLEIFEKFFEDYNQYIRMPKTDVEFASRMDHIMEEFQVFEKNDKASSVSGGGYTQPLDLHRFGSAVFNIGLNSPPIEIMSNREYNSIKLSPLTQPTTNFPVAKYQQDKLTVFPSVVGPAVKDVSFNYIRKPKDPRWGYTTGSLGQFIYDPTIASSLVASSSLMSSVTTPGTGAPAGGVYTYEPAISSGGGTDGKITITIDASGDVTAAVVSASVVGYGYSVGDTITFSGGGLTQALVITLQASDLLQGTMYSTNFEISDSQQTEVIIEILKYAGVIIRDPQIVQSASQLSAANEANTKR
jgi:hypothetical protein